MKATMNFQRPRRPIEIKPKFVFYTVGILLGFFMNIALMSWAASASKADYDNRLRILEKTVDGMPDKLQILESKIDTVQGKIDTVIFMIRK